MKCYYISFCELGGIEETGERFLDKIATLKLGELSDEELMVFNKKIIKTKFIYNDEVFDITYRIKIPEMPPTNEIYEIYENDLYFTGIIIYEGYADTDYVIPPAERVDAPLFARCIEIANNIRTAFGHSDKNLEMPMVQEIAAGDKPEIITDAALRARTDALLIKIKEQEALALRMNLEKKLEEKLEEKSNENTAPVTDKTKTNTADTKKQTAKRLSEITNEPNEPKRHYAMYKELGMSAKDIVQKEHPEYGKVRAKTAVNTVQHQIDREKKKELKQS